MARDWKWNGTTIKTPSEYSWSFADLSSEATGRSLDGTAYKDVISNKRTLTCTWWSMHDSGDTYNTTTFLATIKSCIFGVLTFPDPLRDTNTTGTFYTGDITCTMYQVKNDIAEYKITMSFIEQ